MDSYDSYTPDAENYGSINNQFDLVRDTMGYSVKLAEKFNLANTFPSETKSSTSYCLIEDDSKYLVYQPGSGSLTVDLQPGDYAYEWYNPRTDSIVSTGIRLVIGTTSFSPPVSGDMLLFLSKENLE